LKKLKAIRLAHQLVPASELFSQDEPNKSRHLSDAQIEDSRLLVSTQLKDIPRKPLHTSKNDSAGSAPTSANQKSEDAGAQNEEHWTSIPVRGSDDPLQVGHGDKNKFPSQHAAGVDTEQHGGPEISNATEKPGTGAHQATTSRSYPKQKLSRSRTFMRRGRTQTFGQLSDFHEKQADFESWLKSELEKVDQFYGIKETEALLRFKVLKTQFQELKKHRYVEEESQGLPKLRVKAFKKDGRSTHSSDVISQGLLGRFQPQTILGPQLKRLKSPRTMFSKKTIDQASSSYEKDGTSPSYDDHGSTPAEIPPTNAMDPRQDVVRRRKTAAKTVDYKTARKQIKRAMKEHYRGLELLRQYAALNRSAFQKLDTKHDRIVNEKFALKFMSGKVSKAHFAASDTLDQQFIATEALYARHFEGGNRKVAASKLRSRVVKAEDFSWSMARTGILLGSGLMLAIEGLLEGVELYRSDDERLRISTEYVLQVSSFFFKCRAAGKVEENLTCVIAVWSILPRHLDVPLVLRQLLDLDAEQDQLCFHFWVQSGTLHDLPAAHGGTYTLPWMISRTCHDDGH
jgi:SPX domain